MTSALRELRSYQVRLITDVSRTAGDALIPQPTGSGKTMQIVTLVAMQLGRRFTHAVIAEPQEHIEHGFVHRDNQAVAFPQCRGVAVPTVEVPEYIIWGARQSELGSVKGLLAAYPIGARSPARSDITGRDSQGHERPPAHTTTPERSINEQHKLQKVWCGSHRPASRRTVS